MTLRATIPRLEGVLALVQGEDGLIRVEGAPPRSMESALAGRSCMDAMVLTQQVSAESGVSHALAAVAAMELAAGGVEIPSNGKLLRDMLHSLSLLQAHLTHFYFQTLPDYLPLGGLADYNGSLPDVRRVARGFGDMSREGWTRKGVLPVFTRQDADTLTEHLVESARVLEILQRMMAVVGGKHPVVMSVVPGGVSIHLDEEKIIRLDTLLGETEDFLTDTVLNDGKSLLRYMPHLKSLGRGVPGFISMGGGEESTLTIPKGAFYQGRLVPLEGKILESLTTSFYSLPPTPGETANAAADPAKKGAYSWVKAPRFQGDPMEAGAIARLVITQLTGTDAQAAKNSMLIEETLGVALAVANTVGGRMLARLSEMGLLVSRCRSILEKLEPGQPAAKDGRKVLGASGEGTGAIEAPAGALQHKVVLEDGIIRYYDIISPSTWNGSPRDPKGATGSLETALQTHRPNLASGEGVRLASQIVQSFAFSAADAIQ
ncbi:MAG: nickel-dependent hydrogenase large subunit [Deltaproteobacteria bacterium]|nr:nickel-dependent hydrogenase large subunit [Deltaproteobacteria bacterium]